MNSTGIIANVFVGVSLSKCKIARCHRECSRLALHTSGPQSWHFNIRERTCRDGVRGG